MDFIDRFRRSEGGGRAPSLFEPWSPPPDIRAITAGRGGDILAIPAAVGQINPEKYNPALVIGLGQAGETALRALINELSLDPAGPQSRLHLILLTEQSTQAWPGAGSLRRFELGIAETPVGRRAEGVRRSMLNRFLHPDFYDTFRAYLNGVQKELRADAAGQETRVIVIGSPAEAEIGLLGNLMLLLHNTGGGRGITNRMALLALDSATTSPLSTEEQAIALRELSRLTFLGPHVMPSRASQPDNAAADALIDYLIVIEHAGGLSRSPQLQHAAPLDPAQAVSQAIAETAYLLVHPSGKKLWEGLQNNLNPAGDARRYTHTPFVTGVGVATLFVPIIELQAYVAARLAQAAIYGELPNTPEGLLARRVPIVSYQATGPALARGLLQGPPLSHRLLLGLLEAAGPASFSRLPALSAHQADYIALLPAQAAHNLVTLLNDGQPDPLERAEAALAALLQMCDQWLAWCRAAATPQIDDQRVMLHVMEQWRSQVAALYDQLLAWRRALGVAMTGSDLPSGTGGLPALRTGGNAAASNPPPPVATAALPPLPGMRATASSPLVHRATVDAPPLRELLAAGRAAAEHNLQAIVGGMVRRPLTTEEAATGFDGLKEAERYYLDTIRPELNSYIDEPNARFTDITKRLHWWIRLTRTAPPELLLICLPAEVAMPAKAPIPPEHAVFRPTDTKRLADTLRSIGLAQTHKTAEHLTAGWMVSRLRAGINQGFLSRVQPVYLDFDAAQARDTYLNTLSTHPYLLGPGHSALDAVAGRVFPAVIESAVTRVVDSEPTRLSSLVFQAAIPLTSLRRPQKAQSFNQTDSLFLYEQERLAAHYEAQLRSPGAAGRQFPPDFVVALTRADLIRLFFGGILSGLITVQTIDPLSDIAHWVIPYSPIGPTDDDSLLPWKSRNFASDNPEASNRANKATAGGDAADDMFTSRSQYLPLAEYNAAGEWHSLWEAMRAFTLELPYGISLADKPIHPFHRANQARFLESIKEVIQATSRREDGYRAMRRRADALRARLSVWRAQAGNDALALAFFDVITSETERPGAQFQV